MVGSMNANSRQLMALNVAVLERARIGRGLLHKDVADLAGISKVTVWRAFTTGIVGVKMARAIARVLGLNLANLWVEAPARRGGSAA